MTGKWDTRFAGSGSQLQDEHWKEEENWHRFTGIYFGQRLGGECDSTSGHQSQVCWLLWSELVFHVGRVPNKADVVRAAAQVVFRHRHGQRLGQEPERNSRNEGDDAGNDVAKPPGPDPAGVVRLDSHSVYRETWIASAMNRIVLFIPDWLKCCHFLNISLKCRVVEGSAV